MSAHAGKFPWFKARPDVDAHSVIDSSPTVQEKEKTFNGRKVKVYEGKGYAGYKGFRARTGKDRDEGFEYAWSILGSSVAKDTDKANSIFREHVSGGHIIMVEYAATEKLLRVSFDNGDICIFYNIPTGIGGELISLAQSNRTRADGRHLLGVRFWELVRIPHQHTGAQWEFIYQKKVGHRYSLTGKAERSDFTVTEDNINMLFPKGKPSWVNVGDTISAIIPQEELEKWQKYTKLKQEYNSQLKRADVAIKDKTITNEEGEEEQQGIGLNNNYNTEDAVLNSNKDTVTWEQVMQAHPTLSMEQQDKLAEMENILTEAKKTKQSDKINEANTKLNERINEWLKDPKNKDLASAIKTNKIMYGGNESLDMEYARQAYGSEISNELDMRHNSPTPKLGRAQDLTSAEKIAALTKAGFDAKEFKDLSNKNTAPIRTQGNILKKWTPRQIVGAAAFMDAAQKHEFLKYLYSSNFDGALEYLKRNNMAGKKDFVISD